ncbi:hypothetical protein Tco_1238239 [Tanacetum coccineum]
MSDDLKHDSENENDKVNMPSFPSPKPTVSYFRDLDFFKDFENEFPVIVYNDALMSKSYFLTEPVVSPQHIDEFNLKDETSLSECDEEEQNILYFNDLFPFNIIYPDDLKSDKDNKDGKIDIKHSSGGNVINTDDGAYAQSLVKSPSEKIVKSPSKEVVKSPSEEIVKSPSDEVVKSPSEEIVKSPSEEVVKSPSEEIIKSPSEEVVKSPSEEIVKSPCSKKVANSPCEGSYCFIPFDIKQSFSRLVNLLEVKQHVSASIKEIDNVQLGIVNQAKLKLQPKIRSKQPELKRFFNMWYQSHGALDLGSTRSRMELSIQNRFIILIMAHFGFIEEDKLVRAFYGFIDKDLIKSQFYTCVRRYIGSNQRSLRKGLHSRRTYWSPCPKTTKQITAKSESKKLLRSILLLAIPDEYLLKFHNVPDAKSLWAAIKSRFGGNDESKKMQRNVLKHQFENFTTAPNESLDKAYDRFQKLISQLEVHAAPVSKEDINQKFLRSLPPLWSQISLIMRNKPDIDQTDIDDLYNNLRVYENEMKRSSSSTSNSQNLAFLSSENTSSTNEVSTASGNFGVNTAGGTSSTSQVSSTPGADEVVCSFFAQQTTSPPLDNEDLQQIDQDDLEELDIRWQVAMLTVRVQRFIQKTGRNLDFKGKQHVTFDKRNATTNEPSSQALVAQDGLGGYDWSNDFDEPVNYALMAISSSSSSSSFDNEGYELALESLESRILRHEKNELAWGEKYEFQNYELKCREVKIDNLKMELEKVVKERDESSDEEISPANDRFSKADGYHAVPPPITGNFLTPRADISFAGLDEYAIRKKIIESKTDTSKSKTSETVDCDFYAKKSPEPKVKTVVNTGKRVVKPVWDNAKRVNQQKISNNLKYPQARRTFVPSGVLTRTGLVNPVRPNGKRAVHTVSTARPVSTARQFAPKIAQTGSAIRPIYPRMDNVRPRASYSPIKRSYYTKPAFRPKDLKQDVKTSGVKNMTTAGTRAVVNTGKGKMDNDLKKSRWVWRPKGNYMDHGNPESILQDHAVVDSDELKFNLFSVSQMCDKKNSVLFTDTECLILSPSFKLLDESQVVLRAPRQNGVYNLDLKNIVPSGGKPPSISFMRPFGCPLTILNTLDPLGKFDGKLDEGYLLGYCTSSKAFRVYNKRTKRVKENMHIDFIEDQPNVAGSGPDWMFDLDFLTNTMNYIPVSVENQVNVDAGTDIAKISRKWSKPDNHGHRNGIECAKAERMLSKSYTSSNALIGGNPKGNDTRTMKETHQGLDFCTKRLEKEEQWL